MTWAAFQSTLLLALAGLVPVAIYWLKLWINGKIAELQAKSDANKTRLDQHAEAITDIQQLHGGMAAPAVTQSIPQTSVSSTTRSEPITLSSDVLHETPDRLRVGVVDPHNLASAVIEAQAGRKS